MKIQNLIKAYLCDNNINITIAESYQTAYERCDLMEERLASATSDGRAFNEVLREHRNKLEPTLRSIRENSVELKSRLEEDLYLPNLKSLGNTEARIEYCYQMEPRFLEYLREISPIMSKVPKDPADVTSLHFFMQNNGSTAYSIISDSKPYKKNIGACSDYPEFIEKLTLMFDSLTLQETTQFFEFANTHPKLSLIMIQPYMVSVLGNYLFLKFLWPACSSSFRDPLYNWSKIRKDIFAKVYREKIFSGAKSFLMINKGSISAALLTIFPSSWAFRALNSYLNRPVSIEQAPETSEKLYRGMVDSVSGGQGIERYSPSISLEPFRGLIEAIGTEIGRTGGAFTRGLINGTIDRNRDVAESIADKIDDQNRANPTESK